MCVYLCEFKEHPLTMEGIQCHHPAATYGQMGLPLGSGAFLGAPHQPWLFITLDFFSAVKPGSPLVQEKKAELVSSLHPHYCGPFVYGPIKQTLAWSVKAIR